MTQGAVILTTCLGSRAYRCILIFYDIFLNLFFYIGFSSLGLIFANDNIFPQNAIPNTHKQCFYTFTPKKQMKTLSVSQKNIKIDAPQDWHRLQLPPSLTLLRTSGQVRVIIPHQLSICSCPLVQHPNYDPRNHLAYLRHKT